MPDRPAVPAPSDDPVYDLYLARAHLEHAFPDADSEAADFHLAQAAELIERIMLARQEARDE